MSPRTESPRILSLTSLKELIDVYGKTHFIFDFDRTIATLNINWDGWNQGIRDLINSYGGQVTLQEIIGSEHTTINYWVERYGKPLRDDIVAYNRDYEAKHLDSVTPHQPVVDFIRTSRAQSISIWTSNDTNTITPILNQLGIQSAISKAVGRNDVLLIKPNPEGFNLLFDPSAPKSAYVMIGDSSADKKAAFAAGIDFVNVTALI